MQARWRWHRHRREEGIRNRLPAAASASPWCPKAAGGRRGTTPTALLPLNRTVVRDLGVHPRGEFRTSGAAVGQINTSAASAAFLLERGGLSEQRGWTPRSPRETPKCRERRQSRAREAEGEPCARGEVRGARCERMPGLKARYSDPAIYDEAKKKARRKPGLFR